MFKKETLTNENDILIAPELAYGLPVIVGNAGVVANEDGKKIIKAGTPLYAEADPKMERQTVMAVSGTNAYGVARHDIDVTDGNANDTLLIAGYVDYLKLDATVQSAVDGAKSKLTNITFIKGAK
jgi:hypothetical protein